MNRIIALSLIALGSTWAQSVVSATSGTVNYVEGDVLAGGRTVEPQSGRFASWKKGEELVTKDGRAEILLTPGVFLRISENTKAVLVENKLSDTRVQLVEGSIILECAELLADNSVTLSLGSYNLALRKTGLYRLDSNPASARVFEGEMQIAGSGQTLLLRKGKMTQLGSLLTAEKFAVKSNDGFYRWAARRAEPLSVASFSAARNQSILGVGCSYGNWAMNPYFGMFTYIPCSGFYNSPFGYRFYSPGLVNSAYYGLMQGGGSSGFSSGGGNNGYNSWNRDSYYDSSRGYDVGTRGNSIGGYGSSAPVASVGGSSVGGGVGAAPVDTGGRGDTGGGGGRGDAGAGGRGK